MTMSNNQKISKEDILELRDFLELYEEGAIRPIAKLENVLQGISIKKIKERIKLFEKHYHDLNYDNAKERIKSVIMIKYKKTAASTYNLDCRTMQPGSIFWRARVVGDFNPVLEESEFWAPPNHLVKSEGRVNRVGQGVLYTSLDPRTTAFEVRAKAGDKVFSIAYELTNKVDVIWVNPSKNNIGYSEQAFKKILMISKFLYKNLNNFGREAYVFSNTFANDFFTKNYHGWFYKSTLDGLGFNYCFKSSGIKGNLNILKVYAHECVEDKKFGTPIGLYKKSKEGSFYYCGDQRVAIDDWIDFIEKRKGNGSSGDITTVEDEKMPYTPIFTMV